MDARDQWDALQRRQIANRMQGREGTETQRNRFDLCFAKFQMIKSKTGAVRSAWPVEELLGVHVRKKFNPVDYLADVAIVGKEALSLSPLGTQLFELSFLQGSPRAAVMNAMDLTEEAFEHYTKFVKSTVGRAMRRNHMVPGRRFQEELRKAEEEDKRLKRIAKAKGAN